MGIKAAPHTNLSSYFCSPNTKQFYSSKNTLKISLKYTSKISGFCCKLLRNWFFQAELEDQGVREGSGHDILTSKGRETQNWLLLAKSIPSQQPSAKAFNFYVAFVSHLFKIIQLVSKLVWQDLGHPLWVQVLDSFLNALLFLHDFHLQAPILPPPKKKMGLLSLLLGRSVHS